MALNKMDSVGRKTYFFIFSVLVVFLTATTTKAGFEWVPGTAEAPAPSVTEEQPATDAAVAPEADLTEDTFTPTPELISEPLAPLPISDEKDLAMPAPAAQAAAQPVIQHVAPSEPNVLVVPEESRIKMITPNQNLPVAQTGLGAPPTASAEPSSMTPTSETLLSPVVSQAPKPLIIPPEDGLAPPPEFSQPATLMPPQPEAQPQETAVIPAPQPTRETKVIMPQDAPDSAMTMPGAEKMNIAPYPVDAAPQEITPVQQAAPQPSFTPAESFANAEGFGSDMPLVMALRQVVPPEYAFSFGNGVNPGNHVSWNGGKPWNEVVSDMAASVNLQAQIKGKVVHISRAGAPTPEKAAALQAPASPTPEAVNVESTQAPMDLTEANAAQPAPLMATTIGRNIINDPGQAAAPQPDETMIRIKEIQSSALNSQLQTPESVEPAAGSAEEQITVAVQDALPLPTEPTAATPQAAATTAPAATEGWMARSGDSLKDTLDAWSEKAGIELVWQASHDYTINVDIATDSSFENAVKTVFSNALDGTEKPKVMFLNDTQSEQLRALMVTEGAPAETAATPPTQG